jgi:hypothetical protein
MSTNLSKPNVAECDWIARNVMAARGLVAECNGGSRELDASALDSAYAAWFNAHNAETEDPNPVINAFGMAFGQLLIDRLQLTWVVAADDQSTEMAVHGQPGDILIYPANLVAKRYVQRETEFFQPLLAEFEQAISTVRAQTPARPWWKLW